jgi:hypothetical protein
MFDFWQVGLDPLRFVGFPASTQPAKIGMLVTGYWTVEKGAVRAAQAFAPRLASLLFIKSMEYHNVSSL